MWADFRQRYRQRLVVAAKTFASGRARLRRGHLGDQSTLTIGEGQVIHLINHAEDVMAAFSTKDQTCIDVDHDPRSKSLVDVAFDKSWRFVEKDPFLAHNPRALLRDRLRTHLEVAMRNGEQDLLSLANGAIDKLRNELGNSSNW